VKGDPPTPIIKQHFSKAWFIDASNEAQKNRDKDARRREILFSVCFAESYLFEWTRDELLAGSEKDLNRYFPPGKKRGVKEKWKDVPKQLQSESRIDGVPPLNDSFWKDFCDLVDLRDGLVHARASRPLVPGSATNETPVPSVNALVEMEAGWPTKVVTNLVRSFHQHANKPIPTWLKSP
jgi:hypothetical protein